MAAPTSQQLWGEMQNLENQMGQYNLAQAPDIFRRELGAQMQNFAPQLQELGRAEAQAYKLPFQVSNEFQNMQNAGRFVNPGVVGTQFTGPNPMEVLGMGLGRMGDQFSVIDTLNRGLDMQKGRFEDILGKIGQQYQTGYNQLLDRYNRVTPLYGQALQKEESEKSRRAAMAAQAAQLRSLMGGGVGTPTPVPTNPKLVVDTKEAVANTPGPFESLAQTFGLTPAARAAGALLTGGDRGRQDATNIMLDYFRGIPLAAQGGFIGNMLKSGNASAGASANRSNIPVRQR